jgi:hypothetical protein
MDWPDMGSWWIDAALAGIVLVIAAWGGLLLYFARPLVARWREPVFRCPLLALESDDWGAGPLVQTEALRRVLQLLGEFRDLHGRRPVMTLGVIFEVPDTSRIAHENAAAYRAVGLEDDRFSELREIVAAGIRAGVFEPQLHGRCHYWPDALMSAADGNHAVRKWLTAPGLPRTEQLPSPLQSRWVDAAVLPSRPLPDHAIDEEIAAEAAIYREHFGSVPRVAVATTFIWTAAVEAAWRRAGVTVVITPGRRATMRDVAGQGAGVDRAILTGETSDAGQCYLVRDVYLEPALGHTLERLVAGLVTRADQGRACLVEIHRLNFLDRPDDSLAVLRGAIAQALSSLPELRFVSPLELARAILERDTELIETRTRFRLKACLRRMAEIPRFTRLSRITGLALPLRLLQEVV